ncbi:hypothetical protein GUITHDRAFT_163447 [Guillardia theta CCMP2712]|uniref:FZ domain-containing protein n=1 Tax=Guillardia theta (strain CCMP2712) TaxID=905079 RepID=L1J9M6_GUITC|nr:hypothetical protein GUITHDRAFT_163447 [Guillardia theta CCMP2712]EKX44784.1 hypothetical protein GUITHDRAFT_163447 [Guillardia theta CCMP2712]|eukprot:XP_005831764.1 hypothetical protein GUITHDRAFT_163447 [Guillardia theta CCMP2712]
MMKESSRNVGLSWIAALCCVGLLDVVTAGWSNGNSQEFQNQFPGTSQWIDGYGTQGSPVTFCPWKCIPYEQNYDVHEDGSGIYNKGWTSQGWTQQQYAPVSSQESQAGYVQASLGFVQAGVSTFCKKPYSVCAYPEGDVHVINAMQELLRKTTKEQCHIAMKMFLCTLYKRRCLTATDTDQKSSTYGNNAIYPVCWSLCMNAYTTCDFGADSANLICGQYIKSGWVQYSYEESLKTCDNSASKANLNILVMLLFLLVVFQIT